LSSNEASTLAAGGVTLGAGRMLGAVNRESPLLATARAEVASGQPRNRYATFAVLLATIP
jgi:hypothetical protein